MRTWITSDLHFGHQNIMKFCPQGRARFNNDLGYMNEQMVKEWNDCVDHDDLVYILGDVAFLPADKATAYMRRLNGRKVLVEGNHDRKLLNDPSFRREFVEVHKYLDINYDGTKCVMFHYPIAEWDQMHRGSVHFHGHLHGGASGLENYRARDMGMDATGYIVVEMERAIADAKTGQIKGHHVTV
jgi:calcineurin-like phosphoesterase family protein